MSDHTDLHRHDFKLLADFFANSVFAAAADARQFMFGKFVDDLELGEKKDRTTIWRLIAYAHSLGAEKSAPFFEIKRHGYEITENVARKLRQAGFAESLQMNADDDE